jgi:hypothetical protein
MPESYQFPRKSKYARETPLWLALEYYSYEDYYNNRSTPTLGQPLKVFYLPLPGNVGTSASIKASDDASVLFSTRAGSLPPEYFLRSTEKENRQAGFGRVAPGQVPTGGGPAVQPLLFKDEGLDVNRGGGIIANSPTYGQSIAAMFGFVNAQDRVKSSGALAQTGNNSEGYVDIMDTSWFGSNKKSYKFSLSLKAKSKEDSDEAAMICNELTNLILPEFIPQTDKDGSAKEILFNQTVTHPGVWQPRVLSSTGQTVTDKTDVWLGALPQPCLLLSAIANRVGPNNTLDAIAGMLPDPDGGVIPIQYVIDLTLQEIEPTYIHNKNERESVGLRRSLFMSR